MLLSSPGISPAYMGVGYIIGPKLGALNFSGGVIAWGLLTPMILYFLAPSLDIQALASAFVAADPGLSNEAAIDKVWVTSFYSIWRYVVRPIAIGGMLVSAIYTLWKMRKSLTAGIARSVGDVKKAASGQHVDIQRNEKDISFNRIMIGIAGVALLTFLITFYIFHTIALFSLVAATVMIILAFF